MTAHATSPAEEAGPDRQQAYVFRDVAFEPVFIMGDHRSGTTVLYQLLSATGAFNVVTAYDVICFERIVADHLAGVSNQARQALAKRFADLGLTNRGIDGVAVTPDLPEEYGFIIGSSRPQLRPDTRARLVEICQKIRFIGRDRPVLLKNPWDVLTFAYVRAVFPQAKFIFVHRHPLHVMNSQLAAVRSLFGGRNEYVAMLSPWYREMFNRPARLGIMRAVNGPRFGVGAAIVGRHVAKVTSYYLRHIGELSPLEYTELRYEDLCADPDAAVERVLTFLNRRADQPSPMRDRMRPRGVRILPDVLARYRRIRHRLDRYCRRQGYDLDASESVAQVDR